jgi:hypothetical protein
VFSAVCVWGGGLNFGGVLHEVNYLGGSGVSPFMTHIIA